jgi:hypothetical protein
VKRTIVIIGVIAYVAAVALILSFFAARREDESE